jgi:hypothetical protein
MGEGPADSGPAEEQDEGQLHLEADLHRLLVHSRKVEDEMKHYGQVRGRRGRGPAQQRRVWQQVTAYMPT